MATRIINAGVSLTDTSLTTVYTCPANHKAIVKELWLTNVDGSNAVDETLKWTDEVFFLSGKKESQTHDCP